MPLAKHNLSVNQTADGLPLRNCGYHPFFHLPRYVCKKLQRPRFSYFRPSCEFKFPFSQTVKSYIRLFFSFEHRFPTSPTTWVDGFTQTMEGYPLIHMLYTYV